MRLPIRHKFKPRNKYNAKPTCRDGMRFDSQKEARYYDQLKLAQKAQKVLFFLTQVPFRLPGNTKYTVDFQVFYTDGTVRHVDVKGVETKEFIRAKRQVEALYPVTIDVV